MKFKLTTILIFITTIAFAQTSKFSRNSFKLTAGIGINDGYRETGIGTVYGFGFQRSFWKERIRVNSSIQKGVFTTNAIEDAGDLFYNTTTLGLYANIDALKFKGVSLFFGTGVFTNYTNGLSATDSYINSNGFRSNYFSKFYYGGNITAGIRINPKNNRIAYEITPIDFNMGSNQFFTTLLKFGIDIKLNKKINKIEIKY